MFVPLRANRGAPLGRANPLAKIGAAAALMLAAFISIDLATPAILLLILFAAVPLSGLRAGDVVARSWPLLVAATLLALLNALFAATPSGASLVSLGPVDLRAGSLVQGAALGLRVLVVALSGMLALVTIDPTDLADSLQQQAHLGPRVAVGALAAFRFAPILALEWQTLRLARRARGVEAGRSPLAAARIVGGQLFAMLVGAVRRATRLATAMESRGFGSRTCRSQAREQRMRPGDWWLLAGAAGCGAGAVAVSLALGSWRFVFG